MKFNKIKLLSISILIAICLLGCMEDKPVTPPIPWIPKGATPIDKHNPSTFVGTYKVDNFTMSPKENYAPVLNDTFTGGIVISIGEGTGISLTDTYSLKFGGYPNSTFTETKTLTETENIADYEVMQDNLTIKLNSPITYTDAKTKATYSITHIKKEKDEATDIKNTPVDMIFPSPRICDPDIPGDCTDYVKVQNYIGYYRIENLSCDNKEYIGGKHFAGEMNVLAGLSDTTNVDISVTLKIQPYDETLKQCILTPQENNGVIYKKLPYTLPIEVAGILDQVFENVGITPIKSDDEEIRTTEREYIPQETVTYNPDAQPGNKWTTTEWKPNNKNIKLRIKMQKIGFLNSDPAKTLNNAPYFQTKP